MLRSIQKLIGDKRKQLIFPIFLMSLDAIGSLVMYLMLYFTVIHLLNGSLTGGLVRNYTIVCLISIILRLIIYRSGYFLCFSRGAEMCSGLRLDLANHYSSYKGGLLDEVMRILCDILMAFPLIVIAMALVSAVDNSVASVIIAIGISMLAWFLRMVRSYAKTECGKEYIEAARIAGASGLRIVLRHLIPNVFPQFVVYFTTGIATAIMSVSSFAFLGVGLIAGTPEWGAMLNEARNSVYSNPALLIYPGICLIVCCAGFNLLGEGLRDAIGKEDDICVA